MRPLTYPHLWQPTSKSKKLAVVPAYNEADTIEKVVHALQRDASEWEILVIDDGSVDATAQIAHDAGARVLRLPFNLGIGGAVQAGFTYALEHNYEFMIQVDGDGQHDPTQIPLLEKTMAANPSLDMVCGSRFLSPDSSYPAPI